jgi:hypothetical protein
MKVQVNTDLLTHDLKKVRCSNESHRPMGSPAWRRGFGSGDVREAGFRRQDTDCGNLGKRRLRCRRNWHCAAHSGK